MKARIGIVSEDTIRKHMINVATGAVQQNEDIPKHWFTSLDEVSKVLSSENIELMLLIAKEKPHSLKELANISKIDICELENTIKTLSSKGFVRIEKQGTASRPIALFSDFEIVFGQELENELRGNR
ncbi:transcriptional regulator [Vibrio aestuarianus]|uniref:HVO_A0114 family putative DNA-binding protein n=1 Tax=Vibrio aestuarianus TaxID=28171 RepID=UPI0015934395|nr:transcriptional regulator [Vibrio aestuarianus]MDE1234174.1 transcriptional regulator [Vibrio aestuarianus]MDE1245154.1 transcriptional regulator [Vibrio aestuarianus]NGZ63974.1 transcriptional regulator [Vibrio aestuarianus subsp. cardii]